MANNTQFDHVVEYFHRQLDFINWIRFYFALKQIMAVRPGRLLEVGVGGGFLRDSATRFVGDYQTLDLNPNLGADYVQDVRVFAPHLEERFDMLVITDVLEHMPLSDIPMALDNLNRYLRADGMVIVTIPHRRSNFLFMSPSNILRFFHVPTGFLSVGSFYRRFVKRRVWIDPDHCWEIGDGHVRVRDVDGLFVGAGFEIVEFKKLFYVDYWLIRKAASG